MTVRIADPARTHAVLVGIEKYAAGGDWNRLLGPVPDVLAFHAWLRSRGVPADQIATLVSPREENAALMEQSKIDAKPATSVEVLNALNALRPRHGDLLFLFWAGHGVVSEDERRLFLADATKDHMRNLELGALEKSLRSTYFPGFPLQILLVDACANYQRFRFTFPGESVPCGEPLSREQFIFFAARPGQVAKNLGEERRGLFAWEFLSAVQELPDSSWPPNMRAVAEAVQARFAALRATSDLSQTPIYQRTHDWDGNVVKPGATPSGPMRGVLSESWKLSFDQLAGVTKALMACSKMASTEGRNDLLGQIRSDIGGAVPRRSDTKSDVMNIIRTATDYPGGLEELLRHLWFYDGGSKAWTSVEDFFEAHLPNVELPSEEPPKAAS